MAGGFKRSSWFGLVGVFVVAALVAVIALTMGQGDPNPKLALGLVFGVIAIFCALLLALQRSDLERAAGSDAAASSRAAAEGGHQVENPTTMAEPELWAAMATGPIDADAVRARDEVWDASRRSLRLGIVIVVLIFLTVPAIYLLESFVPLLIGGPLIAIAALYGSFRAIGPGGEIQQSYDRTDRAMGPLGLQVSETPRGGFEMRYPTTPGFDYRLRGWTVMSGQRHGRAVSVRLGGHEDAGISEVIVALPGSGEWSARSRDGRVHASDGAPEAVVAALAKVPNSVRWRRITVESGPEGLVVVRKKGEQRDWLCDLWLAEQLASA
ncbi:MAG TPA: hypothetical protein VGO24_04995 [Solirubrobacterales bacterium]|nr:hypothetical protein [Solirubrobacterales bacterium]